MKKFCLLLLLVSESFFGQKLDKHTQKLIRQKLDTLIERDQKYRGQLQYAETDPAKLDALKKLSPKKLSQRMTRVALGEISLTIQVRDSLERLQEQLDGINADDFQKIIEKYGYPAYSRIKSYNSITLSLHLIGDVYFNRFLPLFKGELEKGNMPPIEYARWYDRNQIMKNGKQLYGEYGKAPLEGSIENTNTERKKIGLSPLKRK